MDTTGVKLTEQEIFDALAIWAAEKTRRSGKLIGQVTVHHADFLNPMYAVVTFVDAENDGT